MRRRHFHCLSLTCLVFALGLAIGAVGSILDEWPPPACLCVEKAVSDLGEVPLGLGRPAEFRIHNFGAIPLTIAGIDGELC